MNADNPPRALPNGYVYSAKAIELLKVDGKIKCPITGESHLAKFLWNVGMFRAGLRGV